MPHLTKVKIFFEIQSISNCKNPIKICIFGFSFARSPTDMALTWLYFIYGLSVMFYGMMTWFFMRKGNDMLSRLIAILMAVLCLQCLKDLLFLLPETESNDYL